MIAAIHQPNFLPWPGFFHKMLASDVFVILNKAQYVKNALFNRNKIKTLDGPVYLTVPVHLKSHLDLYDEVLIDNSGGKRWVKKHLRTLHLAYKKATYFYEYFPGLEEIYLKPWNKLIDLNMTLIRFAVKSLNIKTDLLLESEIGFSGRKTARLVSLCKKVGASTYLSGDGSPYLDEKQFLAEGIGVQYQQFAHPTYRQVNGDFISHLSIVDMLFNCGPECKKIILEHQHRNTNTPSQ